MIQHPAKVEEVLLGGGAFLQLDPNPLLLKRQGVHGTTTDKVRPIAGSAGLDFAPKMRVIVERAMQDVNTLHGPSETDSSAVMARVQVVAELDQPHPGRPGFVGNDRGTAVTALRFAYVPPGAVTSHPPGLERQAGLRLAGAPPGTGCWQPSARRPG